MRWAQRIEIECSDTERIEVHLNHKIEDGPFYQRFMCDASSQTHGVHMALWNKSSR